MFLEVSKMGGGLGAIASRAGDALSDGLIKSLQPNMNADISAGQRGNQAQANQSQFNQAQGNQSQDQSSAELFDTLKSLFAAPTPNNATAPQDPQAALNATNDMLNKMRPQGPLGGN
jgi:hypothetical protein